MLQGIKPPTLDRESVSMVPCKYCRDAIPPDALICKTCYEPQGQWRRTAKFLSATLSSVVAAGSLGIAYLQYYDAKVAENNARIAQTAAHVAVANENAQMTASSNTVGEIYSSLDKINPTALTQLKKRLANGLQPKAYVQSELQKTPTNATLRHELLLHQFVGTNGMR